MITHEELKAAVRYEPETGRFVWIAKIARKVVTGKQCGGASANGYLRIRIGGHPIYAHRLAWFYVHGYWPTEIDHINGDRSDNRLCNLREVTTAQNRQNRHAAKSGSKTGLLGVRRNGSRFQAVIYKDRKFYHLGSFGTGEEAHAAYVRAKRELHEACAI